MVTQIKCPRCGQACWSNTAHCAVCGAPVAARVLPQPVTGKARKRPWLKPGVALAAISIVGAVALYYAYSAGEWERMPAAERALIEKRGPKPTVEIGTGLARPIRSWLEMSLHDARDVEIVEAGAIEASGNWWRQTVRLRARNAQGAKQLVSATFLIGSPGVVVASSGDIYNVAAFAGSMETPAGRARAQELDDETWLRIYNQPKPTGKHAPEIANPQTRFEGQTRFGY